jgi:hypothetical protein
VLWSSNSKPAIAREVIALLFDPAGWFVAVLFLPFDAVLRVVLALKRT